MMLGASFHATVTSDLSGNEKNRKARQPGPIPVVPAHPLANEVQILEDEGHGHGNNEYTVVRSHDESLVLMNDTRTKPAQNFAEPLNFDPGTIIYHNTSGAGVQV